MLASLLFLPGLGGGFIFDDGPNIVHNQAIQITTLDANSIHQAAASFNAGGGSRPLAALSFGLDHWRSGLDPAAFKTTNIVIHALTTIMLAWLFRALLLIGAWPPRKASLIALSLALAWAMHPLQVSSVLYVVQRMQTLGTFFLVLALLAYLKARQAQMEAGRSRPWWMLFLMFWVLAFASKEDSLLLPAYTLAIELTLLRFGAARPEVARALRNTYLYLTIIGITLYVFVVVPHYWHWDTYPGRDYSTIERLLTQGRALCIYMGQILLPFPEHMPFYYDWFRPSRSILQPWTTLPAIVLVLGLLALAWHLRIRRPLFSLGVFLFFAGHFISSNVIGLELAFEHRNHFPLIGAVLAASDLFALAMQRMKIRPAIATSICALILIGLTIATLMRASIWGTPIELARKNAEFAPYSARALNSLCVTNYQLSEKKADSPYLDKAIEACDKGGVPPYATAALTNYIVFKSIRGDATRADWERLHERLRNVAMTPENSMSIWVLMNNAHLQGVDLDNDSMLEAIDIAVHRSPLLPAQYAAIGYFVLERASQPGKAYPYFALSIKHSPTGSMLVPEILADLESQGHMDLVKDLRQLAITEDKVP